MQYYFEWHYNIKNSKKYKKELSDKYVKIFQITVFGYA